MAGAVALCVTLFSVAAGLLTAGAYRHDRDMAQTQLGRLARAAAGALVDTIDQTQTLLSGIAAQEAVATLDTEQCQPVLQGFSGIGEAHLVLVNARGRTLCSSLAAVAPGGDDYAGAPWLAEVRQAQGPIHSEPWLDPVTSRPSLVMAVPAPPGGPATAVLGAVLALDSLVPDVVGPLERSRGTVLVLLDAARRTVLAGSRAGLAGRALGDVPFARRAASVEFEAAYPDDRRRVYHQATVPGLGWHVYAGLPTSVAFAPAREAVDQAAILAATVFLALAVLSVLLHRQVVRPAWALTSAIVSARNDPRAPPAPVRGPAELARIAVEFNSLQEARTRSEEALSQRVAELADARVELRRALVHFTRAQEEQRRLVAQTLHDETVQSLIATSWSLEDLAEGCDTSRRAEVIERARTNLGHAVAAARSLIFALRPPLLDEVGLPAAVEQQLARLAEETGLRTSLKSELEGRLPSHLETLAFRTTEEALRNIRLHARASSVEVHITGGTSSLEVRVDDDGVGFDPATLSPPGPGGGRVGLVTMRETIIMAGGDFTVGPRPAGGTSVSFSLPV